VTKDIPRLNVTPQGQVPRLDYSDHFERERRQAEARPASAIGRIYALYRPGQEQNAPRRRQPKPPADPNVVMLGWPSNLWEASKDQVYYLIGLLAQRCPKKSEDELFEMLRAMDPLDRYEMLRNHGRDIAPDRYHEGGYQEPPTESYNADNMGPLPR
jgi:hypothetical protein